MSHATGLRARRALAAAWLAAAAVASPAAGQASSNPVKEPPALGPVKPLLPISCSL